jgi:hypothetical protein
MTGVWSQFDDKVAQSIVMVPLTVAEAALVVEQLGGLIQYGCQVTQARSERMKLAIKSKCSMAVVQRVSPPWDEALGVNATDEEEEGFKDRLRKVEVSAHDALRGALQRHTSERKRKRDVSASAAAEQ